MSLSSFCHDQLLHGPLSLAVLTAFAVDAGVTKAKNPQSAVRTALQSNEVHLGDDLWATPMVLLEGRCLLTRRFTSGDNPSEAPIDWYVEQDLALLSSALRSGPLPLADGGELTQVPWSSWFNAPDGWPRCEPSPSELLCMRVLDGRLHTSLVADSPAIHQRGRVLQAALGSCEIVRGSRWPDPTDQLTQRLWVALADTPALLAQPTSPLSECVPELAAAAAAKRAAHIYETTHWRAQVVLPRHVQDLVIAASRDADTTQEEWLNDFVVHALQRLECENSVYLDRPDADILPW